MNVDKQVSDFASASHFNVSWMAKKYRNKLNRNFRHRWNQISITLKKQGLKKIWKETRKKCRSQPGPLIIKFIKESRHIDLIFQFPSTQPCCLHYVIQSIGLLCTDSIEYMTNNIDELNTEKRKTLIHKTKKLELLWETNTITLGEQTS